jgi:hypothetical protein
LIGGAEYTSLGTLLDACYNGAVSSWRARYAGHVATQDLFARHLRRVVVASNVLPDGNVDVMVRVKPRAKHAEEVYFFKATRVAGVYYTVD